MEKGQITLFIATGLIVLVIASAFFYMRKSNLKTLNNEMDQTIDTYASIITNYVEQCLLDATVPVIYNRLGLQGGFIDPDYNEEYGDYDQTEFKVSGPIKIPYWYYNGKDISPTIEQVEKRLGRYVLVKSKNCTDFTQLESLSGLEIEQPEVDHASENFAQEEKYIKVSINDYETVIDYYYPIKISLGDEEKTISGFNIQIPLSYGKDFSLAKEVLNRMVGEKNSGGYDLTKDCDNLNKGGYVNIYPINRVVKILDYEPLYDEGSLFSRTFTLQFAYSDIQAYGYCMG